MDYNKLLEKKEYKFIYEHELLKDRILFLCLAGSHSYGTNVEGSDIDIRGVYLESLSELIGLESYEQYVDNNTDTVIYSLKKFIKLVEAANPNVIEMLFCDEKHYLYISPLGRLLLDNRHLFLTKKIKYTFAGYARSQLNRLENALARDVLSNYDKQSHVNRSVQNCLAQFENKFSLGAGAIKTYVGSFKEGMDEEILIDFNLKAYPLGNLRSIIEEITNVIRSYNQTVGQRNKKKDDYHLNKHMMHLIRLYLMAIEGMEKCDMHTYQIKNLELLMSIKNVNYRDSSGYVKKEFYEMLDQLNVRLENAYLNTKLNANVDKNKLNELMCEIYKRGVL